MIIIFFLVFFTWFPDLDVATVSKNYLEICICEVISNDYLFRDGLCTLSNSLKKKLDIYVTYELLTLCNLSSMRIKYC